MIGAAGYARYEIPPEAERTTGNELGKGHNTSLITEFFQHNDTNDTLILGRAK
jgi:hypothetical protein